MRRTRSQRLQRRVPVSPPEVAGDIRIRRLRASVKTSITCSASSDRLRALVFVDAQVPPSSGVHRTPPDLEKLLAEKTVDGILLKWWDWWPPDALERAIPDAAVRAALAADMPRLPRAFYDEAVPVPDGWSDWPCGYVKLSNGYQAGYEEAASRGWPRAEVDGHHLSLVSEPGLVLDAIELVLTRLRATGRKT